MTLLPCRSRFEVPNGSPSATNNIGQAFPTSKFASSGYLLWERTPLLPKTSGAELISASFSAIRQLASTSRFAPWWYGISRERGFGEKQSFSTWADFLKKLARALPFRVIDEKPSHGIKDPDRSTLSIDSALRAHPIITIVVDIDSASRRLFWIFCLRTRPLEGSALQASAAQSERGMRDRFGGGDEVREAHPLVGCRPFLVDTDVARTVLHGRDTEHFLDDVAVTDVAKAPMRADHGRLSRGQSLTLRQRGDERMIRRADHRQLVPGLLGAPCGDFKYAIERRMVLLDAREESLEVTLDRGDRLAGNGAELQGQLALSRRAPGCAFEIVMLLVHHVESVSRKPGKLRMRRKGHPAIGSDRRQAGTDPLHDFHLLLNGIEIGRARFGAVTEKQLRGRANESNHDDTNAK